MIQCLKCGSRWHIDDGTYDGEPPPHDCIPDRGDPVDHPDHYCKGGYECIEVIKALGLSYLAGCAFKYLWRYQYKDRPLEDLKKCRVYLDHLIDQHEKRK